jgi:murein DD-endopeptidase MepM/ murein hydrolase activator NlpD
MSKNLSVEFASILEKQNNNKLKINKILKLIEKDKQDKKKLEKLNKSLNKTKRELNYKHRVYKKELKKIVSQQRKLNSILANLNIVKRQKTKKPTDKPQADKTNTQTAKNMNVRSIGYSSDGVKITRYTGSKTIAPLNDFRIVKTFGETYDKVYKIKLFNDSVTLKTKQKNAKVMCVLDGKVVYSKKNSQLLENVVIIKHKNNMHTIYSHLHKIAPNITKGKWLKKGAVIGRVQDTMNFQATKDSSYINPKELF